MITTRPRLRRAIRWSAISIGAALLLSIAFLVATVVIVKVRDPEPTILARVGSLAGSEIVARQVDADHIIEDVRLTSTSGLVVALKIKYPAGGLDQPRPLLLILGGFDTGRHAVDRLAGSRGTILAAMSYPVDKYELRELDLANAGRLLQRAMTDTPASLLLALDYLLARREVDAGRVEMIGVSLGSTFGCIAGALDERITRVWSIHSGGRIDLLIEFALRENQLPRPAAWLFSRLLGFAWRPVGPENWVARVAPRPFVMINGDQDHTIPAEAIDALFDRAGEPKVHEWLPVQHVRPDRDDVLEALFDVVFRHVALDGPIGDAALSED